MKRKTRRIGIVAFDGAEALDLIGPFDVFSKANQFAKNDVPAYEPLVLGVRSGSFVAESGLRLSAHAVLERDAQLDTVVIPGGAILRSAGGCDRIVSWLTENGASTRRVVSVCTGIYALGSAGLLDGRRATTHWKYAEDVARRWPAIQLEPDAIFIKDGPFYTSAGITAGIDLALALVEEDLGSTVALDVARELVVYLKRSGGQLQYSEPLRFQRHGAGGFGDIVAWMRDHLASSLTVDVLAERANLSPRHFTRTFRTTFGSTPATFVEELRLDEARWRLAAGNPSIEDVATSVGYRSDDAFRRAFQRRFGVMPSEYRARFGAARTIDS